MKSKTSMISSEDVLNAFTVEPRHDRPTLERYLLEFPEYAVELAHLSHELSRTPARATELTPADTAVINEAWKQYSSSSTPPPVNILASLSLPQRRDLANGLGIPHQVIAAFREQRVIVSSIPNRILARIASALGAQVHQITSALTVSSGLNFERSHKADEKPVTPRPATFEQLLIEAQVPADKRAELLSEGK